MSNNICTCDGPDSTGAHEAYCATRSEQTTNKLEAICRKKQETIDMFHEECIEWQRLYKEENAKAEALQKQVKEWQDSYREMRDIAEYKCQLLEYSERQRHNDYMGYTCAHCGDNSEREPGDKGSWRHAYWAEYRDMIKGMNLAQKFAGRYPYIQKPIVQKVELQY